MLWVFCIGPSVDSGLLIGSYVMSALAILHWVLAQNKEQPGASDQLLVMLLMIFPFIAMYYFLVLRPQKKKAREREAMLGALKKGDRVLSVGGIYGVVRSIKDDEIILAVDEQKDVRIRVTRNAISQIVQAAGSKNDNKA